MSSSGTPRASGRHTRVRRFWDRPLGSKLVLVLSSVMLVLFVVTPWQRTCNVTGTDTICGYRFAWQGHDSGWLIGLFALLLVAWEVLPILVPRLSMLGWPSAAMTVLLAFGLVVVTLTKLIVDNEFQLEAAWAAFGVALLVLVTAVVRVRHRWDSRRREKLEAEIAAARADEVAGPPPPGA